jgi:hypothetical protein
MSGYVDCKCRDCFELAIASDDDGAYCSECEEAGCVCDAECQRADAYGCDVEEERERDHTEEDRLAYESEKIENWRNER